MKERRVLLTQAWLMYEANGQIPWQVSFEDILLWFVAFVWGVWEDIGLPKLFRVVIWVTRKLGCQFSLLVMKGEKGTYVSIRGLLVASVVMALGKVPWWRFVIFDISDGHFCIFVIVAVVRSSEAPRETSFVSVLT